MSGDRGKRNKTNIFRDLHLQKRNLVEKIRENFGFQFVRLSLEMKLCMIIKLSLILCVSTFLFGKSRENFARNWFEFFASIQGKLASTLTQEEWLKKYDLIEDDWFTYPRRDDNGNSSEDGDTADDDIHTEF